MSDEFQNVGSMLEALKPDEPVYAIHPRILQNTAHIFTSQFLGDVAYDASVNASAGFLQALHAGGVRQFAVSSLPQLKAVKEQFPNAVCYFTHPVKSMTAIREAAHRYGVMHFTVDHIDELAKIIVHATPLKPTIVVRLAAGNSAFDPQGGFGCSPAEAAGLMRAASAEGLSVGLSIQCDAENAQSAIERLGSTVRAARLQPEIIDIGGGFPLGFTELQSHRLSDFCREMIAGLSTIRLHHPVKLICTPGRALASAGASLVVKVELRRGNRLYLNDGARGGLCELAHSEPRLQAWRINGQAQHLLSMLDNFAFQGPGGDAFDRLPGPYALPGEIHMGDYIEVCGMGAVANASEMTSVATRL